VIVVVVLTHVNSFYYYRAGVGRRRITSDSNHGVLINSSSNFIIFYL
jgi:hypothetical protein